MAKALSTYAISACEALVASVNSVKKYAGSARKNRGSVHGYKI